jgi:hypothetical protein
MSKKIINDMEHLKKPEIISFQKFTWIRPAAEYWGGGHWYQAGKFEPMIDYFIDQYLLEFIISTENGKPYLYDYKDWSDGEKSYINTMSSRGFSMYSSAKFKYIKECIKNIEKGKPYKTVEEFQKNYDKKAWKKEIQ